MNNLFEIEDEFYTRLWELDIRVSKIKRDARFKRILNFTTQVNSPDWSGIH